MWVMPVVALFFSKGLHHSFGREADLGWGLGGEGEAELVEEEVVKFFGFGVAFHM